MIINVDIFIKFLDTRVFAEFIACHPGCQIMLILDNAPYHVARDTTVKKIVQADEKIQPWDPLAIQCKDDQGHTCE